MQNQLRKLERELRIRNYSPKTLKSLPLFTKRIQTILNQQALSA